MKDRHPLTYGSKGLKSSLHPKARDLKPGLLVSLYPTTSTVKAVERKNGRVHIRLADGTEVTRPPDTPVKSFGRQQKSRRKKKK